MLLPLPRRRPVLIPTPIWLQQLAQTSVPQLKQDFTCAPFLISTQHRLQTLSLLRHMVALKPTGCVQSAVPSSSSSTSFPRSCSTHLPHTPWSQLTQWYLQVRQFGATGSAHRGVALGSTPHLKLARLKNDLDAMSLSKRWPSAAAAAAAPGPGASHAGAVHGPGRAEDAGGADLRPPVLPDDEASASDGIGSPLRRFRGLNGKGAEGS